MRKQKRSQLSDDWPPVFSYEMKKDAEGLADKYLDKVSPNYVRQGPDWFVFFEPHNLRVLDVELVHTLPHSSVVASAKFSACGMYVATSSNRGITVFNASAGAEMQFCSVSGLNPDEDMYILDATFHPDSTRVIGVGEDKIVRVCCRLLYVILCLLT
jgi:glucose repression regulatory protein TUP1